MCESTYKAIRYGEFYFIKDKKWQLTLANFVAHNKAHQGLTISMVVIAAKAHTENMSCWDKQWQLILVDTAVGKRVIQTKSLVVAKAHIKATSGLASSF